MTRHRLPLYAAFLLLYLAGDLLGNLLWALTHNVFDFHCLPYPGQVPERILASALAGMLLAVAPAWLWHRWHSRWVAMAGLQPMAAPLSRPPGRRTGTSVSPLGKLHDTRGRDR